MRVDPDQADRQFVRFLRPVGGGSDRAGGDAVIAAEHQRQRAFVQRLDRGLVQPLAHARDFAEYFLRSSRGACVSGIGDGRSPLSTTV